MRYLKAQSLAYLRESISENVDRYRRGDFDDFFADLEDVTRQLPGDFDEGQLEHLSKPSGPELHDATNSKRVWSALRGLTPLQAREERIWVTLSHTSCLEYARARWPIPRDPVKAIKHIETHFFARSLRGIERDNAVSRLWWMGMIASRTVGLSQDEALEVLMFRADVRANLIERPTTSSSVPVFSAVLRKLKASYEGKRRLHDRVVNRQFMKEINSVGGVKLLDALSQEALDNLLDQIVLERLGIAEI